MGKSVIQAHQLTVKNVVGPPVGHDVVKYSDHYVIVVGNAHQRNAGEWPLLQIKWFPDQARDYLVRGGFRIRLASHINHRSGKLHVRNKLEWFAINSFENCTQYLVALCDHVQAFFEKRYIKISFYAKTIADVVRRCSGLQAAG